MEVRGFPASSMPFTAQMKVIGPGEPIKVQVGGDAKLNCYLEPKMDAQGMEVRWFRSQLSPAVHVYEHGQDQTGDQMKEYQGRTELLKDTITDGNLTLKISPVRVSDDGEYRCFFQHGGNSENTTLQLQVTAVGSEPQIRLEGHEMKGIWLGCMTTGWYPAPQVRWKDARGEMVPSWSESLSQDTDGLFAVKLVRGGSSSSRNGCLPPPTRTSEPAAFCLPPFVTAQLAVIGPAEPIVVLVGEYADLPCRLDTKMNAEHMEVRWSRSEYFNVVHLYDEGEDQDGEQMEEYQGRTTLVRDSIVDGRVILRIHNVRMSDEGQYRCFFRDGRMHDEATVELQVAVEGIQPRLHIKGHTDQELVLECGSSGWYPEPELEWRDDRGRVIPSRSLHRLRAGDGLYVVAASVAVPIHFVRQMSCSVRNPLLWGRKVTAISTTGQCRSPLAEPQVEISRQWEVSASVDTALERWRGSGVFLVHENSGSEEPIKAQSIWNCRFREQETEARSQGLPFWPLPQLGAGGLWGSHILSGREKGASPYFVLSSLLSPSLLPQDGGTSNLLSPV
uniref:Ig-like domain-containing protein n=1 Tax=Ornithorhynchus anatinus TaxID=9258 RepID=A0A6I8N1U7_ORNAN